MLDAYQTCLDTYRLAEARVGPASLQACEDWTDDIRRGDSLIWTQLAFDKMPDELPLEDYTFDRFQKIGTTIESQIQPRLRELLTQVQLAKQSKRRAPVESKGLGTVVNELMQKVPRLTRLLQPPPWDVRVNQWRNVAQHHSWEFDGETIVCSYGRPPKVKELRVSRDELEKVRQTIINVLLALGAARAVFLLDRPQPAKHIIRDASQRLEASIADYCQAVASYGFRIIDIGMSEEEAYVVFEDLKDDDPDSRMGFAVSFAYHLCLRTPVSRARAEYHRKDGTPILQATAWAEDCKRIEPGNWTKLYPFVEFLDLTTGQLTPRSAAPPPNEQILNSRGV